MSGLRDMGIAKESNCAVGIMQPYFFPYLGYYQVVFKAEKFVFYDDVSFIKGGWINRNRILINGEPRYLTVSLQGASPNKRICDIALIDNRRKLLRSIECAYSRAPYFSTVIEVVASVLSDSGSRISDLAARSITAVMDYLELPREFCFSSQVFFDTQGLGRAERLIVITKRCRGGHYINAQGGVELYDKEYFREQGVHLHFLRPALPEYPQFGSDFVPGLSMIDVLMFNSPQRVCDMLEQATLD